MLKHNKNETEEVEKSHPSIFKELLNSNLLPAEKSLRRLNDEAIVLVPAAMENLKNTVASTVFYVLSNATMLHRLKAEILEAWLEIATVPSLRELERLPYLTAII